MESKDGSVPDDLRQRYAAEIENAAEPLPRESGTITPEWLEFAFPELGNVANAGEVFTLFLYEGAETAFGYLATMAIELGVDEAEVWSRIESIEEWHEEHYSHAGIHRLNLDKLANNPSE
ncbi:MAG: hypothetical protein Q7S64_01780 [bacterium]|nr:hypothetical protein [bacterium]